MVKRLFFSVVFAIAFVALGGVTAAHASEIPDETELPYIIADGTKYYESSWNFGTGKSGVVNEKNPYTTEPCYAGINGYSYLDENGNILIHDYDETANDIAIPDAPDGAVKLFKHFKSTLYRNGWVDADCVSARTVEQPQTSIPTTAPAETVAPDEPEKQTSKELVDMIEQYDGMTVVIVDRSSSMDDFANQATAEFNTLDIDESTTKVYVFGRYFKEIQAQYISEPNMDVRKDERMYDYLAEVINDAGKYEPKHLIILTDLGVYEGEVFSQPNLETIDILIPNGMYVNAEERCDFIAQALPDVKITIRQFEN